MKSKVLNFLLTIINYGIITILETLVFSLLLNTEGYLWWDSFIDSLGFCILFNLFSFTIHLFVAKWIIPRHSIFKQGIVPAIFCTLTYLIWGSFFVYMGIGLGYKVRIILITTLMGTFLIPYLERFLKRILSLL